MTFKYQMVRTEGLEPPRLAPLEPKSSASTNSATPAAVPSSNRRFRSIRTKLPASRSHSPYTSGLAWEDTRVVYLACAPGINEEKLRYGKRQRRRPILPGLDFRSGPILDASPSTRPTHSATFAGMNELLHPTTRQRTTQAAEGLPRWRWTTAELVRLAELGAFTAEDRFELIGGEIVPMSPVGRRHEVLAEIIEEHLRRKASHDIRVVIERQFNLADDTYCKPDIFVRPAHILSYDLRGDTVLLVVEVAASSLAFDLSTKAALYARHGVREYWVVDAATLATTVHRSPGPEGYAEKLAIAAAALLTPLLVPALALRLTDLELE